MIRLAWAALSLALLASAIFEAVQHGWAATGVIVAFAIMPDLALIGAFADRGRLRPDRVRAYNLLHTPWIPLVLLAGGATLLLAALIDGLGGLALFLAGLGWLLHIAVDRAAGYGIRLPDGRIRPVGHRTVRA